MGVPEVSPSPTALPEDVTQFKPGARFYLAFTAIAAVTLAACIDATSLSIALPIMTKELGGSSLQASWVGTSFLVTSAILMPTYAALSHIFGRKPLLDTASFLFAAGSIIGGMANNMMIVIVGRCIQGVGAGGVIVLGEIIITDLVPLSARGKWLGWLGSMWTIGGIIGPLAGGAFAEFVSWRWIFWINLPFIAIGVILIQFFLKQEQVQGDIWLKLTRVDWVGSLLFTASTASILIPLTMGGIIYEWSAWQTIVPLFLGFDGILAFIWYERTFAREPMIRPSIFTNWTLRSTYIQTILHALVFWAMFYYLPLYYQIVRSYSPFLTGIAMFPQTLIVSPLTIVIGILINVFARYRWSLYMGWLFLTVGAGLLILLDTQTPIAAWIMINIVGCIGIGTLIPAMNFVVQAAVSAKDCGFAVAFYVFLRQFGEGLGVAIGGAVFQNQLKSNLLSIQDWASSADQYSKDAISLGEVLNVLEAGDAKNQLLDGYSNALKMVWIVSCGISALGLASTLLVKSYSMDKKLETEQGFTGERRVSSVESGFGEESN